MSGKVRPSILVGALMGLALTISARGAEPIAARRLATPPPSHTSPATDLVRWFSNGLDWWRGKLAVLSATHRGGGGTGQPVPDCSGAGNPDGCPGGGGG